jgi:uncharacterized membrane protein YdjX (TVP38/TMEM64 family)
VKPTGSGWTSPPVILTIISLIMTALASFLVFRDSAADRVQSIAERVRAVEVRVEGLERRERH